MPCTLQTTGNMLRVRQWNVPDDHGCWNQENPGWDLGTEYKSDRYRPHLPPAIDNTNSDEPATGHAAADACGWSEHDSTPPTVNAKQGRDRHAGRVKTEL